MLNLLQRPELLSAMLASMQDGLSILDTEGVHLYVNDAFCDMLGFKREELLGTKPPHPYWPVDELANINAAFQRTLDADVDNFELMFQRKDGSRIEVIVAPAVLRDEHGKTLAYFATIKDISERKRLERSLLESEQRWRSIAENPFDFVVLINRSYRYTYVNHAAPGISVESLIGRATPFDFVDPQYHDAMRAAIDATFATGRAASYEVPVAQLGAWYSTIVGPVIENREVTQVSLLTRDITAQKRAEETLRRSEQRLHETHRMETIGTLAGGIAHDINNMLTPILASADLSKLELPADHMVQRRLKTILDASQRARELIHRVLLFSRRQEPTKTQFDWRQSVLDDLMLLKVSMPGSIELVTHLPEEPIQVSADRARLGQALTNLVTNALQAMQSSGGTLAITLLREQPGFAVLTVSDTGPGLEPATLQRAFEPFFTTKPVGSGTGLGLSIVQSIIREHGGDVTVNTEAGKGATFAIRLPVIAVTEDNALLEKPVATRATSAVKSLRVLIVDDEPSIVEVAQQALMRVGHVVTTFASALDALKALSKDPNAFDVVLTDQSMPVVKGTELIAQVRKLRPDLPCILMTGLSDETIQLQATALGAGAILAKPFTLTVLCDAVTRAAVTEREL